MEKKEHDVEKMDQDNSRNIILYLVLICGGELSETLCLPVSLGTCPDL